MEESLLFENIMAALNDYGEEVVKLFRANLMMNDKKSSGNLIKNISVLIPYSSTGLEYEVVLDLEDYWVFVKEGLKGDKNHTSPYKAPKWRNAYPHILNWITEKPVLKRPMENGKLPTDKQLAAMISRSIEKNGIEEHRSLLFDSVEAVNKYYLPILQEALERDWEVYSLKILKEIDRLVKI